MLKYDVKCRTLCVCEFPYHAQYIALDRSPCSCPLRSQPTSQCQGVKVHRRFLLLGWDRGEHLQKCRWLCSDPGPLLAEGIMISQQYWFLNLSWLLIYVNSWQQLLNTNKSQWKHGNLLRKKVIVSWVIWWIIAKLVEMPPISPLFLLSRSIVFMENQDRSQRGRNQMSMRSTSIPFSKWTRARNNLKSQFTMRNRLENSRSWMISPETDYIPWLCFFVPRGRWYSWNDTQNGSQEGQLAGVQEFTRGKWSSELRFGPKLYQASGISVGTWLFRPNDVAIAWPPISKNFLDRANQLWNPVFSFSGPFKIFPTKPIYGICAEFVPHGHLGSHPIFRQNLHLGSNSALVRPTTPYHCSWQRCGEIWSCWVQDHNAMRQSKKSSLHWYLAKLFLQNLFSSGMWFDVQRYQDTRPRWVAR